MHDVGAEAAHEPPQGEGGGERDLAAEGEAARVEAGRPRPLVQRRARAHGQQHLVPAPRHALGGEEHLVLPAAPAAGGVHVQDPHARGASVEAEASCSSRSLASFTYV